MKKIRITESQLKNNFNDSLEPLSEFEKGLLNGENIMNSADDNYIDNEELDYKSDDDYATNFIISKLTDAQEIMNDLIDYLQNSPYAIERGGESFKRHLSKATNICNEIEKFWDDEEAKD